MGILEGKVAVVIGGGRGIGRAVALLYAREGASVVVADPGCDLVGAGTDPEVAEAVAREIRESGGRALGITTSTTTHEGARDVVAAAAEGFGRLDTLVYTAGIGHDQPLGRTDERATLDVLGVHLVGALFATQAAARVMQRAGGGRIVLTTSSAGLLGNFGQPAYSAAAAGVYGFMRAASMELQRHSVFVNAVAPLARTRLTESLPLFEGVTTLTPEHVAPAYLFLGSERSGDRTGNVVGIAGGRVSLFKLAEGPGRFKDTDGGIWTATELESEWPAMARPLP
jgi:NAD(P)-dependent dehydrogenase (short-subunit alcohol dehydrogenase family)